MLLCARDTESCMLVTDCSTQTGLWWQLKKRKKEKKKDMQKCFMSLNCFGKLNLVFKYKINHVSDPRIILTC